MSRHAQYSLDIARHQAMVDIHAAKLDLDAKSYQPGLVVPIDPPEAPLSFLGAITNRIKGAT